MKTGDRVILAASEGCRQYLNCSGLEAIISGRSDVFPSRFAIYVPKSHCHKGDGLCAFAERRLTLAEEDTEVFEMEL